MYTYYTEKFLVKSPFDLQGRVNAFRVAFFELCNPVKTAS